jgi:hypothetical protein
MRLLVSRSSAPAGQQQQATDDKSSPNAQWPDDPGAGERHKETGSNGDQPIEPKDGSTNHESDGQ